MIKYIHLDYRKPHTKEEGKLFGLSNVDINTAHIFINTNMHRKGRNLADTFFHEMAHVFIEFHGKKGQMSAATEEELATLIGRKCAEVLK